MYSEGGSNEAKAIEGGIEFSRGGKAIDRPSLPRCYPHHTSAATPTSILSMHYMVLLVILLKNESESLV
jgi:hypothetical protein